MYIFEREKEENTKDSEQFVNLGIIYDEGKKVVMMGGIGLHSLQKITEKELEELLNDCDPIDAPPGSYTIQPNKPGRIVWVTGAPGMGKSTSAQMLGRDHGYVYYEADCFMGLRNPYVPLDVENPTLASLHQKTLKGPGAKERQEIVKKMMVMWGDIMTGREFDIETMLEFYRHLALDIKREKERIGGDFAVATVLMNRETRDQLRRILGDQLVIVLLTMSMEERRERILVRHSGDKATADRMDVRLQFCKHLFILKNISQHFTRLMKPLEKDEPNCWEVKVTGDMSRTEVVEEILRSIS